MPTISDCRALGFKCRTVATQNACYNDDKKQAGLSPWSGVKHPNKNSTPEPNQSCCVSTLSVIQHRMLSLFLQTD